MADLLVVLFYLPTRHLHEYARLLLKLVTCFEVVGDVGTFYVIDHSNESGLLCNIYIYIFFLEFL